jgi:hypothetical protein
MTRRPPDCLVHPVAGVVAVGLPVDAGGARRYVVIGVAGRQAGAAERDRAPPGGSRCHHNHAHPELDWVGCRLLARRWPQPRVGRRLAAVGLMAAGALAGALLLRVDVGLRFGPVGTSLCSLTGLGCRLDGNPVVTMAAGRTAPGPPTCRHMRCRRCEQLPNQQRTRGSNPVTGGPAGDGDHLRSLEPDQRWRWACGSWWSGRVSPG